MLLRLALLFAGALALAGCDEKKPTSPSGSGEPQPAASKTSPVATAAVPARPDDPTPDPITHPCVVKAAQFDVELAKNELSCQSHADCDCYPGGISKKAGCGGVRAKASAKRLHGIYAEFRKDGCDLEQQCAASACEPRCVDGSCQ